MCFKFTGVRDVEFKYEKILVCNLPHIPLLYPVNPLTSLTVIFPSFFSSSRSAEGVPDRGSIRITRGGRGRRREGLQNVGLLA